LLTDIWSLYSILGFLTTATTHALVVSGMSVPTDVLTAIVVALFPVFIMAVLTHPTRRWEWDGVSAEIDDDVPKWIHAIVWGSLLYLLALWTQIPERRFSISGHLDHAHQLIASWAPAVFYAAAFALRWSARRLVI
jgi:hypothetical protein